ncbi:TPA: phage tail protein [Enterobacter kobei]
MALTLLAANNAQTVLAAGISASATSLTVNSGTGSLFPAPSAGVSFFKLTLIDAATGQLTEIVHVTARSGDTMTINRAQEGTTARAWSANDIAANMMTAGTLSYLLTNFQPLDATLSAIAALTGAANKLAYFNGPDTAALTDLTSVGRDIISKSTIADILTYLGLGDVAKRTIGNGAGQVPDMNFFGKIYSNGSVTGGFTFPNGMIIQTAAITSIPAGTSVEVTYPIPFPTTMCFATAVASGPVDSTVPISIGIDAQSVADARKTLLLRNFSTRSNAGSRYFAIGY